MNNKFDELTKQMAKSVTRRAALKKFGVCLAGMVLVCFGLANNARASKRSAACDTCVFNCVHGELGGNPTHGWCQNVYCKAYC